MQLNPFHKNFLLTRRQKTKRNLKLVQRHSDHSMQILYATTPNYLTEQSEKYGSDKGAVAVTERGHNYTDFYHLIFDRIRNKVKSLLECGIGRDNPNKEALKGTNGYPGASLRVWRDYFPNAEIVGLDIAENVLFSEKRITTYQVDQTDSASIAKFKDACNRTFDIIIDDGLHRFAAGKPLFENIIDRLAVDGIYIIEDVKSRDLVEYSDYFASQADYFVRFVNLHRPNKLWEGNSLVMITKK